MLRNQSRSFLLGAAACWGLGTVLTKQALGGFTPEVLLPLQLLVSVVLLCVAFLLSRGSLGDVERKAQIAALGVLNPGVSYALGLAGLALIDASTSVIIWATEPVIITVLAVLVLREHLSARLVVCLAVAMVGVSLVLSPSMGGDASALGVLLLFGAVTACAVYTVLVRMMDLRDGALPVVFLQQASALAFAVVLFLVTSGGGAGAPQDGPSVGEWTAALTGGVLYYGLAFLFYVAALKRTTASAAGVSLTLIPVFGLAFSVLLLGESLNLAQVVGSVLVIGSMAALALGSRSVTDERIEAADRAVPRRAT